jgi:hypothetical protein
MRSGQGAKNDLRQVLDHAGLSAEESYPNGFTRRGADAGSHVETRFFQSEQDDRRFLPLGIEDGHRGGGHGLGGESEVLLYLRRSMPYTYRLYTSQRLS